MDEYLIKTRFVRELNAKICRLTPAIRNTICAVGICGRKVATVEVPSAKSKYYNYWTTIDELREKWESIKNDPDGNCIGFMYRVLQ